MAPARRRAFLHLQLPLREPPREIMEPVAADAFFPVEEAAAYQLAERFVGDILVQSPKRCRGGSVEGAREDGQNAPEPLEGLRNEPVAQVKGGIDSLQPLAAFGELAGVGGGREVRALVEGSAREAQSEWQTTAHSGKLGRRGSDPGTGSQQELLGFVS